MPKATEKCEVFGTNKGRRIRVMVAELNDEGKAINESEWNKVLGWRAHDRLVEHIERALAPPVKRKPKEGGGDGE